MSALLTIAPHIAWNNVEGELALFDTRNGSYHALNPSGAEIWRAIAAGQDEAQAAGALAARYHAPHAEILADIRAFIADARARGLLEDMA